MQQQRHSPTLQSASHCSIQHMDKLLGGSARELLSAAVDAAVAARQLPHAWRLQLGEARLARLQDAVRDPAQPPYTFLVT